MKKVEKIHQGFKIPENYFEDLDDRIIAMSSKEVVPAAKETENHFKVPPSYFEGLEDRILNKSKGRVIRLGNRGFSILSLAAAASMALLISINFWNNSKNTIFSWDELQDKDVIGFIDDDYEIFSSSDIADAFEDVDLEAGIYAEMDIENYLEEVDLEKIIPEN